ncbi:hypothetical protein NL676_010890 [Syzygium grande]|nr:hypothetical protein NL676_010890 [Syzygium grande]
MDFSLKSGPLVTRDSVSFSLSPGRVLEITHRTPLKRDVSGLERERLRRHPLNVAGERDINEAFGCAMSVSRGSSTPTIELESFVYGD